MAENTTESSVTSTGSTPVNSTPMPTLTTTIMTRWKRAAGTGGRNFPQDQPKNWASVYPLDNVVSSAAPNVAATIPSSTTATSSLPAATAIGSMTCPSVLTWMDCGSSTTAAHPASAIDSTPPSGHPTTTLGRHGRSDLALH